MLLGMSRRRGADLVGAPSVTGGALGFLRYFIRARSKAAPVAGVLVFIVRFKVGIMTAAR